MVLVWQRIEPLPLAAKLDRIRFIERSTALTDSAHPSDRPPPRMPVRTNITPRRVIMRLRNAWTLGGAILLFAFGVNAAPPDTDGDGTPNNGDNCPSIFNPDQQDGDDDGVGDVCDNCLLVGNAGQEDADGDAFGNICDADLDNDGIVGVGDFTVFSQCANHPGEGATPDCASSDFNSDNRVSSLDFQILEELWGLPPGPSGLAQ